MLGLLVVGLLGWLLGFADYVGDPLLAPAMAVGFGLLGPWVARRGVSVIGRRMTIVGLVAGLSWAAQTWSHFTVTSWLSQWTWELPVLLVPLVLIRFPRGTVEQRWRWVERLLLVLCLAPVVVLAIAALGAPHNLLTGGAPPRPAWTGPLVMTAIVASALWLLTCLATGALLCVRAVRAPGQERSQIICLGLGLLVLLGAIGGLILGAPTVIEIAAGLALPTAVAAAVLRYALYDLDLLVNRLLVWLGLTGIVAVAFVAVVTLLSEILPGSRVQAPELIALLLLALILEPVRRRLQTGVNRLLFGRRSAPAEAFALVGRDLGRATTAGSGELLCHTIAATLQLPWVGIRSLDGTETTAWGRQLGDVRLFPLLLGETKVGELAVCPRRASQPLTRGERTILDGMAAQVAVAVQAMTLADDLQRARQRVVASRELERQRLRADLHDGLAPSLVGIRMQAAVCARQTVQPAVATILQQLSADADECVAEVSRVIEGLRPTALDQGLESALQAEARRLSGGATAITIAVTAPIAPIPETSELAAFRIAGEAISNAVRHAGAAAVRVEIGLTDTGDLLLQVVDDGTGLGPAREGSVGLQSMRHRAEDAGGFLTITTHPGAGTTVAASLPRGQAVAAPA